MDELQQIELNVSRLLSAYEQSRRDNDALQQAVHDKDEEIFNLRTELKNLQSEHRMLQTAHALTVDSPDRLKAKRQIQSIIADIDKTIDILRR